MSLITTPSTDKKGGYGTDVFQQVNSNRSGIKKAKMRTCAIKMYPDEREDLEELFAKMGLSFSSGVRHVLTEYKNKHAENT